MRSLSVLTVSALVAGFVACSDDDGSNITPNGPPGVGGGGAGGRATNAGSGGGGTAGGGAGGRGGGSMGGTGGSAGCTVAPEPDAGPLDAGLLDAGADGGELDASSAQPIGRVSFEADLHPIFEVACNPCHVTLGTAGHNVGGELNAAYDDAVRLGSRLVSRINGGGMPPSDAEPPYNCGAVGGGQPGDEGCLTVAQVALVQAWIDQCYPR
jgi:hypothetical protein